MGVLIFEMLTGQLPFRGKNKPAIQKAICGAKLKMPTFLPSDATSLIKSLLERNQDRRLGAGPQGTENVKGHKFFASVNWSKIEVRGVAPPFRPTVEGEMCVACFDEQWTKKEAVDSAAGTPGSDDRNVFQGFSFTAPSLMLEADVALAHAAVREKRAEMERMIREESLSEDGTEEGADDPTEASDDDDDDPSDAVDSAARRVEGLSVVGSDGNGGGGGGKGESGAKAAPFALKASAPAFVPRR